MKDQRNPTVLTRYQYERALECYRIHKDTPTLSQLAREWGVHKGTLISAVGRGIKKYDREIADALQGSSSSQGEASRVLKEVVREEQSFNSQAGQGTKERVQSQVVGVQGNEGLFQVWDIPHSGT